MVMLSKPPPNKSLTPSAMSDTGWPQRSARRLANVECLLNEGKLQAAVSYIGDSYLRCPWTSNALAVCHLRLGNYARAIHLLQYIVFDESGLVLREDVPIEFKINFALALLADGNLEGFLSTFDKLKGENHPSVQRLNESVTRWKESLTGWQKFWWNVGGHVPLPPIDNNPLGELGAPRDGQTRNEVDQEVVAETSATVGPDSFRPMSHTRRMQTIESQIVNHSAQAAG